MTKVLLHCCCAPCSLSCIEPLKGEGLEPVALWYNPNIHPWKEYVARRDCLVDYASSIRMELIVAENYGLKSFVKEAVNASDGRCSMCYRSRLDFVAKYAAEAGFEAFTTTLLASVYQNHELIASIAQSSADRYGVSFLYRDFRPNFRAGNARARELGLYMQSYCGCIFSEEERYDKQIRRDAERFGRVAAAQAEDGRDG
ncbi:MAG: epoxyqueuosine reductase QueH [Clostridia bacterium]|nr:epoxyqueuosine reductase QueH [Clostridia bacterium]